MGTSSLLLLSTTVTLRSSLLLLLLLGTHWCWLSLPGAEAWVASSSGVVAVSKTREIISQQTFDVAYSPLLRNNEATTPVVTERRRRRRSSRSPLVGPYHPSRRRGDLLVMEMSDKTSDNNERSSTSNTTSRNQKRPLRLPQLVIFDLDGCLWRPEMYELLYFSGGAGAPFTPPPPPPSDSTTTKNPNGITTLLTCKGEPVYLLGNVPEIMRELYLDPIWHTVKVGISSRTNEPNWARELLQEFKITKTIMTTAAATTTTTMTPASYFTLENVMEGGPIEMASDAKIYHFERIAASTGIPYSEMLFFDNEYKNCQQVAQLGVTVAYCPDNKGVDFAIWEAAMDGYPAPIGQIIQVSSS
jgi:magnesium-dependent phosphatase 1